MRSLSFLSICLAVAAPAVAQVTPHRYPVPYGARGTTGDVHRYEIDRLRATADRNDALARQQALDTRLTLQALQAARRPAPIQPEDYRLPPLPLRSPKAERAAREAATEQSRAVVVGVTQIDAWLDRGPR